MLTERIKRLLLLVAVVAPLTMAVAAMPACNTVEGAGQDIERAGEEIEDAAD